MKEGKLLDRSGNEELARGDNSHDILSDLHREPKFNEKDVATSFTLLPTRGPRLDPGPDGVYSPLTARDFGHYEKVKAAIPKRWTTGEKGEISHISSLPVI